MCPKILRVKRIFDLIIFWYKKIFGQKSNTILVQNNLSQRSFVQKNIGPQKLRPKKIRSVTPEIMLIWTNVARIYVASTQNKCPHDSWHLLKKVLRIYL